MPGFGELIKTHKYSIVITIAVLALLILGCVVWKNGTFKNEDHVLGVDVSAYQGKIDWPMIKKQGIMFAYIKATEGTDFVDDCFDDNWKQAKKAGVKRGAYLFANFKEDGTAQAKKFIDTVSMDEHDLPPVIDLELYGDYIDNPPEKKNVTAMLDKIIKQLEDEYNVAPIIYTNYNTYNHYLSDGYSDTKFWICDISTNQPKLDGGQEWVFWQYSQRQILNGYDGDEMFIDMNVFNGDLKEFKETFAL